MRFLMAVLTALAIGAGVVIAQPDGGDRRALRERIEQGYEVVPVSDGLVLRPRGSRERAADIRLIEIARGTISVNGTTVSGGELRQRLGADADPILRLSYLTPEEQRTLFAAADPKRPGSTAEPGPVEVERGIKEKLAEMDRAIKESQSEAASRPRRSHGDRVRIFGNVVVEQDEELAGEVVAVLGSARVDGAVRGQVVAVLGSVDLGPTAVVGGDVVAVGGRVRRSPGAQLRGGVTEVSLSDASIPAHARPWFQGWGPYMWFGDFGAAPRLVGTGLRLVLLLLLTGIVLLIAGRSVEASAERVSENPLKTTVIGLLAEVLIPPVLILTAVVLAISIIGIPLLLLLPFVVLLFLLMALVGFAGTAAAIGRSMQRRFSLGMTGSFISIAVGVLVILSPLLLGRVLALAGWPATPFALLLVTAGFAVELLAWSCGFGAVLSNAFTRWQGQRAARTGLAVPPGTA